MFKNTIDLIIRIPEFLLYGMVVAYLKMIQILLIRDVNIYFSIFLFVAYTACVIVGYLITKDTIKRANEIKENNT